MVNNHIPGSGDSMVSPNDRTLFPVMTGVDVRAGLDTCGVATSGWAGCTKDT